LGSTKVAGVGVGQGERAGGDHGEVQDGGWGVSLLTSFLRKMEYGIKNKIVFWILVGIVFKVKAMICWRSRG